jgi:hypothetical protein
VSISPIGQPTLAARIDRQWTMPRPMGEPAIIVATSSWPGLILVRLIPLDQGVSNQGTGVNGPAALKPSTRFSQHCRKWSRNSMTSGDNWRRSAQTSDNGAASVVH